MLYSAAAGDTIAEASLFSPAYHCDAIATTAAVVRLYPKAAVLAEFQRNPKAAQAFTAMLARQVMSLRTRLEQRNIHSARERVRHYLAVNAGPDGRTVTLAGTLKDLAGDARAYARGAVPHAGGDAGGRRDRAAQGQDQAQAVARMIGIIREPARPA